MSRTAFGLICIDLDSLISGFDYILKDGQKE